jgi:hypothetical protein
VCVCVCVGGVVVKSSGAKFSNRVNVSQQHFSIQNSV